MGHIFLDLDGTLTDPRPGIVGCFLYALEQVGHAAPEGDTLNWIIGPALVDSFAQLGVRDVQDAVAHYRVRYSDVGLFENEPYAGVVEVLAGLKAAGHTLCLATAKPHVYATRITEHFGIAPYLSHQFGPELDGTRNNKGDLLAYAIALTGADPAQSVMVGDRHHDMDAAKAVGMASIAARWGYGQPSEWGDARSICGAIADLPQAVDALLGRAR